MELKVTVDGIVRVVCGVSEETTCQDIVIALARAIGRAGRFSLLEKWRNKERSLPPWEKPFEVLQKWGQYSSDVQFVLQQTDGATAANKKAKESVDKSEIPSKEDPSRAQNFSPIPQMPDYTVKRSLTFSGAPYSSQEKSRPSRSQGRRSLPLATQNQSSTSSTPPSQTSSHSYYHYNQVPKQQQYPVNSSSQYHQNHQHQYHHHHQSRQLQPSPPPPPSSSSSSSNQYHTQRQPQQQIFQAKQPQPPSSSSSQHHSPPPFSDQHYPPPPQQQQQHHQQIFQNKPPYIQKPISSIRPQPKPRNLPLKSNNDKQPVRTIGTVSPIQSHSQLSVATKRDNLPCRILHNNVSRPSSQNRAANITEISKNNNYYSKNNSSNVTPNIATTTTTTTNNNNYYNNNNESKNNSNNNCYVQTWKDINDDVTEKSTFNEFKNISSPSFADGKSKGFGSIHSGGGNSSKSILRENRILSDIEEYDLEGNYPLSAVSPMPTTTTTTTTTNTTNTSTIEYYRLQGQNFVDQQTARDQEAQFLNQLIERQHNEIELKKTLIKDLEQEIISAEEEFENGKEIAAFESLSNSYAEELEEAEDGNWERVVDKEIHRENVLKLELASHRLKLDSMEDRLREADGRIAELSRELESEVKKFESEINTMRKKLEEESTDDGKHEEILQELNEQLNQVENEIREKESKESELMERVKDLNLKDLEKSSIAAMTTDNSTTTTTTTTTTGDSGTVVLKLLEKQHQFGRQGSSSRSKEAVGCKTPTEEKKVETDDTSVLSGEGVWV